VFSRQVGKIISKRSQLAGLQENTLVEFDTLHALAEHVLVIVQKNPHLSLSVICPSQDPVDQSLLQFCFKRASMHSIAPSF
jgi:hypothetical protein